MEEISFLSMHDIITVWDYLQAKERPWNVKKEGTSFISQLAWSLSL